MSFSRLLFSLALSAALCSVACAVLIDTVLIGNPGNVADTQVMDDWTTGYGSVGYLYRIGRTEVSNSQYVEFLNTVDPTGANTLGLYNTSMTSDARGGINFNAGAANGFKYDLKSGHENNPVVFVSWYDSARFINWLHNGQGSGSTETGAYTLLGGTPTPSNGLSITRNVDALWFLPSEDEWYKAAYHKNDGITGNYWNYPVATDALAYSAPPPGTSAPNPSRTANMYKLANPVNGYDDGYAVTGSPSYVESQNYLTDVGAYSISLSAYQTLDQGGNAWEWHEALVQGGTFRGVRGGSWAAGFIALEAPFRADADRPPTFESRDIGLRVASLPSAEDYGDFNEDGTIDAADYVVWRKGFGTIYTQADYDVWREHFGQAMLPGSGSSAPAAAPEPMTIVAAAIALLIAVARLRRAPHQLPRKPTWRRILIRGAMLAVGFSFFLPTSSVRAQTSTWIGGTGSWYDAANWQGGVPNMSKGAIISNGGVAQVSSGFAQAFGLTLGVNAGESGTVQVSGTGSLLPGYLQVGYSGTGAITITGGVSNSSSADLGYLDNSVGTVTVTGATSGFAAGTLRVGVRGTGSLTVENGADANSTTATIGALASSVGSVTVDGSGSIWRVNDTLAVGGQGTGTLTIKNGGTVDALGSGAGQVNIAASSTLNIGDGGAGGVVQAVSTVNNGLLNFDHTDAVTLTTPISGGGEITKTGAAGDTTLTNVSAFTGSFSVQSGLATLQGNANASDYLAGGSGTLRFSGGTVDLGLASIQATATGEVEYDRATVRGGFLRGPGTHTILAGASDTVLNAVTTFNSTNLVQDGTAALINFTNGGTLTNNAALSFNGGANASSGVINVNSTISTYDVANNGVLTVNSGGAIDNYVGNLVSGGGSRTTINSGGAINLLGGTTLELNGALLVNNGEVAGTTNVNYGSLAKGAGTYGVVNVFDGGTFSPGNSPGEVNVASMNCEAGGRLVLEIRDFAGTAGVDFDQILVAGDLNFNAGTTANSKFTIELVTLGADNQPGPAANFDPAQPLSLPLINVGGAIAGFSIDEIAFDLSGFENDLAGGSFEISPMGNGLSFSFQPSPASVGDFNEDGTVDAADYVVWRNGLGTTYNQSHYDIWWAHFGQSSFPGAGSSAQAAAPEPAGLIVAAIAILIAVASSGRVLRRVESQDSGWPGS
jgi:T5SS/PEP-CTERM-associated repeat protein